MNNNISKQCKVVILACLLPTILAAGSATSNSPSGQIAETRNIANKLENAAHRCQARLASGELDTCTVKRGGISLSISEALDIARQLRQNAEDYESYSIKNPYVVEDRGTWKSPGLNPGTTPEYDRQCVINRGCMRRYDYEFGRCLGTTTIRMMGSCMAKARINFLNCRSGCQIR